MAILNNNPLVGASGNQGGYNINNSLRLRSSASAYLNRTPASTTNRRTFTYSFWYKRGEMSTSVQFLWANNASTFQTSISLSSDSGPASNISITLGNGSAKYQTTTTAVFRDPSAWYHIVIAVDTTQATSSNRLKIYVNGEQQTAFSNVNYPPQNFDTWINSNSVTHYIGASYYNGSYTYTNGEGYLAEVNFVDGSQLTPSSFGETDTTTGVWKPKAYSGTYGTNGFYLKFSDIATTSGSNAGLGKDFSGNSNYWTTNNISVTSGTTYDAMTDSPTNTSATVANYATLNPNLRQTGTGQAPTSANLKLTANTTGYSQVCCATIASPSGKFYWEVTVNGGVGTIGIADSNNSAFTSVVCSTSATTSDPNEYTWGWSVNLGSGNKKHNNVSTSYGSAASSGDVYMCAVDIDNSKVWWGKNGTWFASGSPTAGTNAAYTNVSGNIIPYLSPTDGSGYTNDINFGQRPFSYTPPTGFVALNTYNLPDSTIKKGNKYMDATLYTGTGATQTITNAGSFRPDLVWVKVRSTTGTHVLTDSNRGANKQLFSNLTNAEASATNKITGFTSTGFTLGADDGTGTGDANFNGSTYVGWQWQAGQNSTSSNTSGTITSTVSVNTTAGFSIVTYTGTGANATVGHGLGVAPKMIIVKNRNDGTTNWAVYHVSTGANAVLFLNSTATPTTVSGKWGTPSSTTFGVNTAADVNANTQTMVAYCWAEISGFSKFGSYTGNGSTDGTFVYTGFRPEFIMFKRTNDVSDWNILDATRSPYNTSITRLFGNSSNAENSSAGNYDIDILSNGFKQRNTNTSTTSNSNLNGSTYIYMAFAENPMKYSLGR